MSQSVRDEFDRAWSAFDGEPDPEKRRDMQLRVLMAHARMTSDQLADHAVQRRELERALQTMDRELRANTEITEQVRDMLATATGFIKVLRGLGHIVRWLGYLAAAVVAIYGAAKLLRGGPL